MNKKELIEMGAVYIYKQQHLQVANFLLFKFYSSSGYTYFSYVLTTKITEELTIRSNWNVMTLSRNEFIVFTSKTSDQH